MIELVDVAKTYPNGLEALKPTSLFVERGDIMGLIGYSGAGKSTLIRLINRLEEPSRGNVLIEGKSIIGLGEAALQKLRQKIGMIFQHFNLLSSKTVFGNIAFALEIANWKSADISARVEELLSLVGLEDKARFYPGQLSGGQKQRVAIARALANNPNILLCDEATSALDTKTTRSILGLLARLQKKLGLTIVLITHQIEVVREICNHMCVMSGGEIVERGAVEEVFSAPKHEVTRELLSFLPQLCTLPGLNQGGEVYKILFVGQNANRPVISEIVKKFNLEVNIRGGNIDLEAVDGGHLFVSMLGDSAAKASAIEYLRALGLEVSGV